MNNMERIQELRARKKELEKQIAQLSEADFSAGNVRVQVSRGDNYEQYKVGVYIDSKRHWITILYANTSVQAADAIREISDNLCRLAEYLKAID